MTDFPHTDDPLVAALQSLLARAGGHVVVGDKAGVSDQSLYQIAYLKPHSRSGKLKSVGSSIRARLDAAYPGWLGIQAAASLQEAGDTAQASATVVPIQPTLAQALPVVLEALSARPEGVREELAQVLALYLKTGAASYGARITELLAPDAAQQSLGNRAA